MNVRNDRNILCPLPATNYTRALVLAALSLGWVGLLSAQTINQTLAEATLPDAPGFSSSVAATGTEDMIPQVQTAKPPYPPASPFQREILAGETSQRMSMGDKVIFGLKGTISPLEAASWVVSAGYEQVTDGSPNYGQTFKGYSQRLGAAAARDASANIAGESVLAPILHEDPRYYQMGDGHGFIKRVIYAGTRAIFIRTDSGKQTVNFQLLGGHLAAASMTQFYYPPLNRSFSEVAKTFATTVGESGVGFEFREFFGVLLESHHLRNNP